MTAAVHFTIGGGIPQPVGLSQQQRQLVSLEQIVESGDVTAQDFTRGDGESDGAVNRAQSIPIQASAADTGRLQC